MPSDVRPRPYQASCSSGRVELRRDDLFTPHPTVKVAFQVMGGVYALRRLACPRKGPFLNRCAGHSWNWVVEPMTQRMPLNQLPTLHFCHPPGRGTREYSA